MNVEYVGSISDYLILFIILGQIVFGLVISVTTSLVSNKLRNKQFQKDLRGEKKDHKTIRSDLKELSEEVKIIHLSFNGFVARPDCKSIRVDLQDTFCRKIDGITENINTLSERREADSSRMNQLIGQLTKMNQYMNRQTT